MAKPGFIELPDGSHMDILHEDRCVLAIDKPAGWMLLPPQWRNTSRNLLRALMLSMREGDHWAHSRNLRYIRFIHRLDAETSGVLLLAKSPGVLSVMSRLFESRAMHKKYLALVRGVPSQGEWTCRLKIAEEPGDPARMRVDERTGVEAETQFRVLKQGRDGALVEARPVTGRTHQIRLHLASAGHPVMGDTLYGSGGGAMALRAVEISYTDPFQKRPVRVVAPTEAFLRRADEFLNR